MKDIYIIKRGDTIESIAQAFKMRATDILDYNRINTDSILPGVILVINKQDGIRHVVKPMETIDKLAIKYDVSADSIRRHNNIREIFLGQIVFIPEK